MLIGEEVSIPDMMERRETRVFQQQEFIDTYGQPLVSFCLNIPGPVKTTPQLRRLFDDGFADIKTVLADHNIETLAEIEVHEKTGDEALLSCSADASLLKDLMTAIEEEHPLGRLFDIDIIATNGQKLSRPSFRKCLICERQAQDCARARTHTVAEMQEKISQMLAEEYTE